MTKEEILINIGIVYISTRNILYMSECVPSEGVTDVLKAMDEYAKQQAIAFMQFCFEKEIISDDFDRKDGIYFDGNHFYDPSFNESALSSYNIFIEQQNKDNG